MTPSASASPSVGLRSCRWVALWCALLLSGLAGLLPLSDAASRPTVGAIRWDAWNQVRGQYDAVSHCVQIALAPQRYQPRLPFYARVLSPTNVTFDADSQAVMDAEILYAARAGLDYFIFDTYCAYGANCSTTSPYCRQYAQPGQTSEGYCPEKPAYGRQLYLSSQHVDRLNFS